MREMKQTIDISTKQEKAPAVRPCDLRRLWLCVRPPARWRALGGLLVALGIVRNEQESARASAFGAFVVTCFNSRDHRGAVGVFCAVIAYTNVNAVRGEGL